jgi:hypothetical protein
MKVWTLIFYFYHVMSYLNFAKFCHCRNLIYSKLNEGFVYTPYIQTKETVNCNTVDCRKIRK